MKTENKIYDRIVSELDYCMSKEFKVSKDAQQKQIDDLIMKVIWATEHQIEDELRK